MSRQTPPVHGHVSAGDELVFSMSISLDIKDKSHFDLLKFGADISIQSHIPKGFIQENFIKLPANGIMPVIILNQYQVCGYIGT